VDARCPTDEQELAAAALHQRVRFATALDGVQIAWASVGKGPPVLKAPNWLNHLEYEWRSPVWGPAFAELARHWRLVRFDQRGNGLSDWEADAFSEDLMISDMATVADAAGLERFALLGTSQGCPFSIRYAVEQPERVTCLVLLGGYLRGRLKRSDREQKKLYEALIMIIRKGKLRKTAKERGCGRGQRRHWDLIAPGTPERPMGWPAQGRKGRWLRPRMADSSGFRTPAR
jgi:pimeloyl-ACP methyl ester carboxylesterase